MVWVSGYLNLAELIAFLRRAKARLIAPGGPKRRSQTPSSMIFLLDNVLEEGMARKLEKRQRFRTPSEYENIFAEVGLVIHK